MKKLLSVALVLLLIFSLTPQVLASDGGAVPDPKDHKEEFGSYNDNKNEPEANEVIDISTLKNYVNTEYFVYHNKNRTLKILKDGAVITGSNPNLEIIVENEILHITFRDVTLAGRNLISYYNGQALWIKLEGENMLYAKDKFVDGLGVMFHGQGEVGIYGEKDAFKDNNFELAIQDATVNIAVPAKFKKILLEGEAKVTALNDCKFTSTDPNVVFAPESAFEKYFPLDVSDLFKTYASSNPDKVVDVSELADSLSDMEDSAGNWYYNAKDKRLILYKTAIVLTGTNNSLSIEPTKGASIICFENLTINSKGSTCACGKSCAICNARSFPVFQKIDVEGKNEISVANGSVLYWGSENLELFGNGKITFKGNGFAFSDSELTFRISGVDVTFTDRTDFKEIVMEGGSIYLPKGNEEANITNNSSGSHVYFNNNNNSNNTESTEENPYKFVTIPLIWAVLVPSVLMFTIIGLVIALIYKKKKTAD